MLLHHCRAKSYNFFETQILKGIVETVQNESFAYWSLCVRIAFRCPTLALRLESRSRFLKEMKMRKFIFLLSALLVAGCSEEPAKISEDFPFKLSHRFQVSTENPHEVEHWVYVKEDGTTKVVEQIEYDTGVTTYIFYRPDQFAEKIIEYYPGKTPDLKERQIKSEVYFESESSDFKYHKGYLEDGTLVKTGRRFYDGSYKTITYFEDGKTLHKEQLFARDKFMISESEFRKNGNKSQLTTTDKYRNVFIWKYRDDNTLWLMYEVPSWPWSTPGGKYYREDGRSLFAEFKTYFREKIIVYVDESEKNRFRVQYDEVPEKSMTILVFDTKSGEVLYQQRWKLISGALDCSGSYTLEKTIVYKPGSTLYYRLVDRQVIMSADGKSIDKVRIPLKPDGGDSEGTEYQLYPSSFVASKRTFVKYKVVTCFESYLDGGYSEPLAQVDSKFVRHPDFVCLPIPEVPRRAKPNVWVR